MINIQQLKKEINLIKDELIKYRRHLHTNAEIGFELNPLSINVAPFFSFLTSKRFGICSTFDKPISISCCVSFKQIAIPIAKREFKTL